MPDDQRMFDLFRGADAPAQAKLDAAEIIRLSRRRRLPRRIGAGALGTLAVAGIGVTGVSGLSALSGSSGGVSSASDSAASTESDGDRVDFSSGDDSWQSATDFGTDASAPATTYDSGLTSGGDPEANGTSMGLAPADKLNLCGGTLAEVAPNERGLELTVDFPDAAVGTETVTGTVTLTNSGTETVTGYTAAAPAITLSQDNVVLWHSSGVMIMLAVDVNLAPGASMSYPATFSPVVCSVEDDLADALPGELPAAPAGQYQVGAAIAVMGDAGSELVTGPTATVTLR